MCLSRLRTRNCYQKAGRQDGPEENDPQLPRTEYHAHDYPPLVLFVVLFVNASSSLTSSEVFKPDSPAAERLLSLAWRLWSLRNKYLRLCAFAPLRELGFIIQAAVLAKAQRGKGEPPYVGLRGCV
jgi:hypothetical protein